MIAGLCSVMGREGAVEQRVTPIMESRNQRVGLGEGRREKRRGEGRRGRDGREGEKEGCLPHGFPPIFFLWCCPHLSQISSPTSSLIS